MTHERRDVVMHAKAQARPVVHRAAADFLVIQDEPHRADDVQLGARRHAQPRDVPGVRRDLGVNQRDLQKVGREDH